MVSLTNLVVSSMLGCGPLNNPTSSIDVGQWVFSITLLNKLGCRTYELEVFIAVTGIGISGCSAGSGTAPERQVVDPPIDPR